MSVGLFYLGKCGINLERLLGVFIVIKEFSVFHSNEEECPIELHV